MLQFDWGNGREGERNSVSTNFPVRGLGKFNLIKVVTRTRIRKLGRVRGRAACQALVLSTKQAVNGF